MAATAPARGVNGLGLLIAAGGAVTAYSGIKNASIAAVLRSALTGDPLGEQGPGSFLSDAEKAAQAAAAAQSGTGTGSSSPPASGGGAGLSGGAAGAAGGSGGPGADAAQTALNAAIIVDVQQYLGVPYVFGGATPKGFDCSGLVTWVLHHDLGLNLPSNTHTVTAQWYVWSGAVTVPNSQRMPGDLVCYPGHIGIAADPGFMINAPDVHMVVKRSAIFSGSITRRVKVQ